MLKVVLDAMMLIKKDGASIMKHQFFEGVLFEDFLREKVKAPWVPELKSQRDTCFFEKYPEQEDSLTEIPFEVDTEIFGEF